MLSRKFFEQRPNYQVSGPEKYGQNINYEADIIWVINNFNFDKFKPNQQMVNYFQNDYILDRKDYFYQVMQEFDKKRFYFINSSFFLPKTYTLNFDEHQSKIQDEDEILSLPEQGVWIQKPVDANCGQGITIIHNIKEIKQQIMKKRQNKQKSNKNKKNAFVIQKYIENPLLIFNKKFDIRCFIYVVSAKPFIVLYRQGYIRRALEPYNVYSKDRYVHLVNHAVQKGHPDYKLKQDEIHWNMEQLNNYFKHNLTLTEDQIDTIYRRIKATLTYGMLAAQEKLIRKPGMFQIFGADIMLDDQLNPYYIEINRNPYLAPTTPAHKKVVPFVIKEFIETSITLFDNRNNIDQLAQYDQFITQHCEECEILINEVKQFNFLQDYYDFNYIKPKVFFTKDNNYKGEQNLTLQQQQNSINKETK